MALVIEQEHKVEKNEVAFAHGEQRDKFVITVDEVEVKSIFLIKVKSNA